MMPAIASLYESIRGDLERVCRLFDDELFSDLPAVNALCEHVRGYRGKMLRPALLLLSGRACGGLRAEHHTLAAVVEMVHLATLVHDDVLDEAAVRRRRPTVNRLHGNEAAVLLGDYLISHAYHLCSALGSQVAARKIASATNTVCEGELQQVHHRGDRALSVEEYLQIVSRKTGALTAAACGLGAHFAGADERTAAALEGFGLDVGIAFQITDDVLDIVGSPQDMGKTLGRDLEMDELTLPVIHCLSRTNGEVRRRLTACLDNGGKLDRGEVREVLTASESLTFAFEAARRYSEGAAARLEVLPPSEARETLARLARMIVDRRE